MCCGTGCESNRLVQLGAKVVGIDFSKKSIDMAKKVNKQVCFYEENALSDYSYIDKVDGAVLIGALVHFTKEELSQLFLQLDKVMKLNGFIFYKARNWYDKGC